MIRARVAGVPSRVPEPTYHEIRVPAAAAAPPVPPPVPRVAPPVVPPPVAVAGPPTTPRVPLPATAPTTAEPAGPRPDPAVVSDRGEATTAVPLRAPSLPETLRAARVPDRPRPAAARGQLATRLSGAGPRAGWFSGARRYLLLSVLFRGIGLLAVLGGLALLLLALLA